jgi:cytochrome c peroxidase
VDKRPQPGFVKAYGHNGYFKSLKDVVHFYNTRDVLPYCVKTQSAKPGVNCWPEPEVAKNVNTKELGNLRLSEDEEWAIIAFLRTLSDGWAPK